MVCSIRAKKLVVPEYDSYEAVYDGVFYIKKLTAGILGEHHVATNQELLSVCGAAGYDPPVGYYPSVFSRKMLNNDFKKNIEVYPWYPDEQALDRAAEAVKLILSPHFHGSFRSFQEVKPKMTKSTSPGYPYNKKYKSKGLFMEDPDDSRWLEEAINEILLTGKLHKVWLCKGTSYLITHVYWQSSPKGEIRPVDKLLHPDPEKRKTRTFMCGCILSWFLGAMLYGDQNDAFLEMHRTTDWSAVGMTPFYGGWDRMARLILGPNSNEESKIHCLDAAHMEAFRDNIQTRIYGIRNSMIVAQDVQIRNGMVWYGSNIIYKYYIDPDGDLLLVMGNNPSGGFNTLVDNTIALILAFLYCIALKCSTTMEVLEKYHTIRCKLIGDDSIFAETEHFVDLIPHARHLGFDLKYEVPVCKLSEAKFLNAGFSFQSGFWFMAPNFEKIRASVFYLFKSNSWRLAYVKVCAYRKLCFPFLRQREEADIMLRFIRIRHDLDMRREHSMDDKITYLGALANYMPDHDNLFLLTGQECAQHGTHHESIAALNSMQSSDFYFFDYENESVVSQRDCLHSLFRNFRGLWNYDGDSVEMTEDSLDMLYLGGCRFVRYVFEAG